MRTFSSVDVRVDTACPASPPSASSPSAHAASASAACTSASLASSSSSSSDSAELDIGIERDEAPPSARVGARDRDRDAAALPAFDAAAAYAGGKVLVLGSGGVIGRALTRWLRTAGVNVLEVRDRRHIDLREPRALERFDAENVSFAYFLACEVGGSKFLDNADGGIQQGIIESNLLIYQSVFPYLARRGIPFVFTSSSLQAQPTTYGAIKRLGERWVESLPGASLPGASNGPPPPLGRSVRLWNVYGDEPIGVRSHVLTDWVAQCVRSGAVRAVTDGAEARQFLHASDCAAFLGALLRPAEFARTAQHHANSIDLSSGVWTSLRSLAELVATEARRRGLRQAEAAAATEIAASPSSAGTSRNSAVDWRPLADCAIAFTDKKAVVRTRLTPRLTLPLHDEWQPEISLERGIELMFDYYEAHRIEELATEQQQPPPTAN